MFLQTEYIPLEDIETDSDDSDDGSEEVISCNIETDYCVFYKSLDDLDNGIIASKIKKTDREDIIEFLIDMESNGCKYLVIETNKNLLIHDLKMQIILCYSDKKYMKDLFTYNK